LAEKILKVKNLSFSYDGSSALNVLSELNFEVEQGIFISILGPNGSGKSTLINLISKVLRGYKGNVEISGKDIEKMRSREIAKLVAVVPQYSNPGFDFTVEEMVLMGRFPYISRFRREKKEDFEVAEKIMEKTKILGFAKKKFNELSGGEKQRVIIAQALSQNTPVILLDEPTSHLDINFQIEIMDLFYELNQKENKTVIGVFHDINLAANYSREIILLKQGRIWLHDDVGSTITKENIKSVFNSEVYVGKNPVTGKLYVSPIFSPGFAKEEDYRHLRVHVIGGGGAASPVMNMLYSRGYVVSCGVINNFDTDIDTAEMFGISYISEAPFSPISLYSQHKNLEFIKASDVVILPEIAFGHGNFSNLVSVKEAMELGKKVIVVDRGNLRERDYTDGKAAKLYKKILDKGAVVVQNIQQILEVLTNY
jgi:iron complex transport system ATP-binding protein